MPSKTGYFDVAIIGSGFASSILAWILARAGKDVALVDRARHPRFAIGESSTPLADFLLELIADKHALPELRAMSRWGTWQEQLPNLGAGMKRGFSYFQHQRGEQFHESHQHEHSLLVAASANDLLSDTHWLRSDVDHWLIQQAQQAGVTTIQEFSVERIADRGTFWEIWGFGQHEWHPKLKARCLIDGSGSAGVVAQQLGARQASRPLRTDTSAIFGHFQGVSSFDAWLAKNNPASQPFPFPSDAAAQHHLIEEGWVWMLRFRDDLTSVGLVHEPSLSNPSSDSAQSIWDRVIHNYPSLAEIMSEAELVNPTQHGQPTLGWLRKVNRVWEFPLRNSGSRAPWCVLPNTLGVVDPLHSTGIAHGLWGTLQLADAIIQSTSPDKLKLAFQSILDRTTEDIRWIDQLISTCYQAKKLGFASFAAACCLYFVAAIHSERQLSETGVLEDGFLLNQNKALQSAVSEIVKQLATHSNSVRQAENEELLVNVIRRLIAPWNDVGLLEPAVKNRIARSVAPKS